MTQQPRAKTSRLTQSRLGLLQMVAGTVIISFSAVFVRVSNIGPAMAGFYRVFFGALVLLVIVLVRREALWKGWGPFGLAVAAGVFFSGDLVSWHRSIHYIGPGLATILANFQVFFLALVGFVVFREKATWRFLVSVPLAVAGLFLLVGVEWEGLDAQYKTGVGLGLVCAMMYTGYLLILRRSQRRKSGLSPAANLAIVSLVTAAILAVVAPLQGESFAIVDWPTAWALIGYGVLCQAVAWIMISSALAKIDASRVGLLLLLQPTLTFIWDMLFFGRPTTTFEMFGATIILGAIYLGNTRSRPKTRGNRG